MGDVLQLKPNHMELLVFVSFGWYFQDGRNINFYWYYLENLMISNNSTIQGRSSKPWKFRLSFWEKREKIINSIIIKKKQGTITLARLYSMA